MHSSGLSADTRLGIHLGAICTRNRYCTDPDRVIDELRQAAGERVDILASEVGSWIGYFEDPYTMVLTTALRELPGVGPWIEVGRQRRATPSHSTPPLTDR